MSKLLASSSNIEGITQIINSYFYSDNNIYLESKNKNNLINEVKFLREKLKLDDEWLLSLGLEYKYVTLYLQNKINYDDMVETLQNKIWQYAKRQILWNKRYKNVIIPK